MNKNKIIFGILLALFIGGIIYVVSLLNSAGDVPQKKKKAEGSTFTVWIIGDDKTVFEKFFEPFKSKLSGLELKVESFKDYSSYLEALKMGFLLDKGPDIFVLNNNDSNLFEPLTLGIDPTILSPSDFRKGYKQFFGDDLIKTQEVTSDTGEKKTIEYVLGVPVGYETLGIFYNRKFLQAKDVTSWASISSVSKSIKEKNSDVVPVGLGVGSTVVGVADIITQFFMLGGVTDIATSEETKIKEGLSSYGLFSESSGDNGYFPLAQSAEKENKTNINLFAEEKVALIAGYPRMLFDIKDAGYTKKNFLLAAPFPTYFSADGKGLVNYNYFVINKNTKNFDVAQAFLLNLTNESTQKSYIKAFPYYFPSQITLESDVLDEKISPDYNISLKDFFRDDMTYSSFNKGIKTEFDRGVKLLLDDVNNTIPLFDQLKKKIICEGNKLKTFENLSTDCGQ